MVSLVTSIVVCLLTFSYSGVDLYLSFCDTHYLVYQLDGDTYCSLLPEFLELPLVYVIKTIFKVRT